jgi:hypothetical protein
MWKVYLCERLPEIGYPPVYDQESGSSLCGLAAKAEGSEVSREIYFVIQRAWDGGTKISRWLPYKYVTWEALSSAVSRASRATWCFTHKRKHCIQKAEGRPLTRALADRNGREQWLGGVYYFVEAQPLAGRHCSRRTTSTVQSFCRVSVAYVL